jgi:hypothetical protein
MSNSAFRNRCGDSIITSQLTEAISLPHVTPRLLDFTGEEYHWAWQRLAPRWGSNMIPVLFL